MPDFWAPHDLVVLVPSRGRPRGVARLAEACAKTCRADTVLHFAFDVDDPALRESIDAADQWEAARVTTGPRDTLTGWTNQLAAKHLNSPALASLGDDMVPVTDGWDERLLAALPEGGGYAYPNDLRRDDIPEAVVISTPIVAELGWFSYPGVTHWYCDNIWSDIGRAIGCITYCSTVIVEHRHPNVTGEPGDATYAEAATKFNADLAAYQQWRLRHMAGHVDAVRGVRKAAADPLRHAGSHAGAVHLGEGVAVRAHPGAGSAEGELDDLVSGGAGN